jgi:hypothetical protein
MDAKPPSGWPSSGGRKPQSANPFKKQIKNKVKNCTVFFKIFIFKQSPCLLAWEAMLPSKCMRRTMQPN